MPLRFFVFVKKTDFIHLIHVIAVGIIQSCDAFLCKAGQTSAEVEVNSQIVDEQPMWRHVSKTCHVSHWVLQSYWLHSTDIGRAADLDGAGGHFHFQF